MIAFLGGSGVWKTDSVLWKFILTCLFGYCGICGWGSVTGVLDFRKNPVMNNRNDGLYWHCYLWTLVNRRKGDLLHSTTQSFYWHSETVRNWSLWWVQCVSSPLVFGLSRCLRGVSVESFRVIEAFSAVGNVDICAPSEDLWRRPEVETSGSDWKSTSNPATHNLPIRHFIAELSRRVKLNALLAHGSAAAPDDFSKPTSIRSANTEIIANMRGVLLNSPQAPVFRKGRFFPGVHRAVRAGCDTIRCSPFSWCCVHGLLYRRPGRVFSAAL